MEFVFAILLFALAAGGLGIGLAVGRAPPKSCSGTSACAAGSACAGCPRARARRKEGET